MKFLPQRLLFLGKFGKPRKFYSSKILGYMVFIAIIGNSYSYHETKVDDIWNYGIFISPSTD